MQPLKPTQKCIPRVFVAVFYMFNSFDREMRNDILISLWVWSSCQIIDECDEQSDEEDSTMTPPSPGATDIMKGAAALW